MYSRESVLVVEDDPDFAGNVRGALEAEGYQVRVCATGREALNTMADKPAQLVVLNLEAAGGDALELVDGTKRLSSESEIVVIASRQGLQDALQAFKDKAFAYLTEPAEIRSTSLWLRIWPSNGGAPEKCYRRLMKDCAR